jgi:hypothetical protein
MGVGEFEMAYLLGERRRWGHAQRRQARASKADSGDLEELPTVEVHRELLIRWKDPIRCRVLSITGVEHVSAQTRPQKL